MTFVYEQEVVQRLFDDQEDEQGTDVTDKNPEMPTDQPPDQVATVRNKLKVAHLSKVLAQTSSCCLLSSVPPPDSVWCRRHGWNEHRKKQQQRRGGEERSGAAIHPSTTKRVRHFFLNGQKAFKSAMFCTPWGFCPSRTDWSDFFWTAKGAASTWWDTMCVRNNLSDHSLCSP